MMKKMRIMALGLIVSVALVGAGYAAWGNTITANTTLSTGHWEVVLEDSSCMPDAYATEEGNLVKKYVNVVNPSIVGNNVSFSFTNLHPGTTSTTKYHIINKGTIPAKIKGVTVELKDKDNKPIVRNEDGTITVAGYSAVQNANLKKLFDAMVINGNITRQLPPAFGNFFTNVDTVSIQNKKLYELQGCLNALINDTLAPTSTSFFLNTDELQINNLTYSIPMDSLMGNEGIDQTIKVNIIYDFVQYNGTNH
jgi:hypothetical protein